MVLWIRRRLGVNGTNTDSTVNLIFGLSHGYTGYRHQVYPNLSIGIHSTDSKSPYLDMVYYLSIWIHSTDSKPPSFDIGYGIFDSDSEALRSVGRKYP